MSPHAFRIPPHTDNTTNRGNGGVSGDGGNSGNGGDAWGVGASPRYQRYRVIGVSEAAGDA